ncbi:hypothetical protein ILYODFUR_031593 [Ilyodon furcidens]|uniref:Uncharacterized protein n=1 Tax=Ilyodon furcidens TaxID=33524 RepID=A0ABV0VAA3_9TELE
MKTHSHSARSTPRPAATPPQPPPARATEQTPPRTVLTTDLPTPHQGKLTQQEVSGQGHEPRANGPRNHTNTSHRCHCNDSPGRSTNQVSSTITAQPIQMLVTTNPKRGHNPPTPHSFTTKQTVATSAEYGLALPC